MTTAAAVAAALDTCRLCLRVGAAPVGEELVALTDGVVLVSCAVTEVARAALVTRSIVALAWLAAAAACAIPGITGRAEPVNDAATGRGAVVLTAGGANAVGAVRDPGRGSAELRPGTTGGRAVAACRDVGFGAALAGALCAEAASRIAPQANTKKTATSNAPASRAAFDRGGSARTAARWLRAPDR